MGTCSSCQKLEIEYGDENTISGQLLHKVEESRMNDHPHKHVVAIIWRKQGRIGRGSGMLISRNLVLSCAHNFIWNGKEVGKQYVEVYPGICGRLTTPYKVQQIAIPTTFKVTQRSKNVTFDYALIKLAQPVNTQDFIRLKANFIEQNQKQIKTVLAIYGYPLNCYENAGVRESYSEKVVQAGLWNSQCKLVQFKQKKEIRYQISTESGQSGAGILHKNGDQLYLVGIHKGGVRISKEGNGQAYNSGRLITDQLINILQQWATKMKAQLFCIARQSPNNTFEPRRSVNQAKLQNEKGNSFFYRDDFEQAIKCYRKAIKINPEYATAYKNLAQALSKINNIQEAIQNCEKAIALNQKQVRNHKALALILQKTHDSERLITCYKNIVELNKSDIQAYMSLGQIYQKQNKLNEAIELYEQVHKISPTYEAYLQKGKCYRKAKKYQQAISSFTKALEINPQISKIDRIIWSTIQESKKQGDSTIDNYLQSLNNQGVKVLLSRVSLPSSS